MPSRRKQLTRDFQTCRLCGYVGLVWPPKDSRQTNRPLDRKQPLYLDVDSPSPDAEGYDSYGYRHRGRRVTDLSAHEQREADARSVVIREGPARTLRIMKCWPIHACPVGSGPGGPGGPPAGGPEPEPTGKERACPN